MDRDRHFRLRRVARPQFCLPIFVLAFLLLGGCGADEPPEAPLRPVRTLRVVSTGGSRVRTFSGATQAGITQIDEGLAGETGLDASDDDFASGDFAETLDVQGDTDILEQQGYFNVVNEGGLQALLEKGLKLAE